MSIISGMREFVHMVEEECITEDINMEDIMRKTANCKVKRTVNRGYMVRERQPPWMTQGSKHEIKSEKADQEEDKG